MTVGTGYFASVSQSGTGNSWTGTGNLDTGGEAIVYDYGGLDPLDLYLYIPDALSGVANGSEFTEMAVTLDDKMDDSPGTITVRWTGTINGASVSGTSYSWARNSIYVGHTLSGDAAYWGLSAHTPTNILRAIRDGTLKFKYSVNPSNESSYAAYIRDVQCEVTYVEADTRRAALKACVP